MAPTFTYSLQGTAPNQYLQLDSITGTFEPNTDLVLDTDIWPGDGLTYPVKAIVNNYVFGNNSNQNTNLKSITMNNLTSITGFFTFFQCTGLQSISFPNLVSFTGNYTFYNCTSLADFTQVDLGTTITAYPNYTFYNCNFSNIILPANIITLGNYVFNSNLNLQSFTGPNLTSISSGTFSNCKSLTDFTLVNLGTTITRYPDSTFTNCNFPNITLPSHITELGNSVFSSNINLQSFTGPNLTSIGSGTFLNCTSLIDLTLVNLGTTITRYPDSTFTNCNFPNITLPSHITELGNSVFSYNANLQSFTGPNLTSIGSGTFLNCTSLTDLTLVNLGTTITRYPDSTFNGCGFINITLPPHITELGDSVFSSNINLQSFTGPNLTSIGFYTFSNCKSLTDFTLVNLGTNITTYPTDTFGGCGFINITLPTHITTLNDRSFVYNISLKSFSGPNIISIGVGTFENCTSLQTCVLGPISSIPDFCFNICSQLKNLYIRKLSPPTVSTYSFNNVPDLQYIFIPNSADWTGFTNKIPWNVQFPITSTPTYSLTPSSASLNTITTTSAMPPGYTVPYYTYKWYRNSVQQSSTMSSETIVSSLNEMYTVKAFDPFNQESNTEMALANILIGINYVKIL